MRKISWSPVGISGTGYRSKRGKGIGKRLLIYAMDQQKVKRVDVNEQNDQAVGFRVVNRSEFDGAGKHYPILSMELKCSPAEAGAFHVE